MGHDPIITARIVQEVDGPTLAEANAIAVLSHHSTAKVSRTRDVLQLDIGGDRGCTVLITAEAVEIRLPTIEWVHGAYGPRQSSRLWKRIDVHPMDADLGEVERAIKAAIAERKSEFATCIFCGRKFPPERMTDDACHGCASRHRGIVY